MGKIEKEVKILNIDVQITKNKLENIGAKFISKKEQKIYTYDVPCIYMRFQEACELLKFDNELIQNTAKKKLTLVLDEFVDLISEEKLRLIYEEMNIKSFNDLIGMNNINIINKINSAKLLKEEICNYLINPNKWLRLRKNNDKVELTIKHIFNKHNEKIQKVQEFEIDVSDLEEANKLLEQLGIIRRNYQEKIRHSYKFGNAEIETDEWPNLEPYMEIECDDEKLITEIINKLELNDKRIVSLNTEQLYREKGIDILKISDLTF